MTLCANLAPLGKSVRRKYTKTTTYTSSSTFYSNGSGTFEITVRGGGGGCVTAAYAIVLPNEAHGAVRSDHSGGAGGKESGTIIDLPRGNYTITVGGGGASNRDKIAVGYVAFDGNSGGTSSFIGGAIKIEAFGGGGGHAWAALKSQYNPWEQIMVYWLEDGGSAGTSGKGSSTESGFTMTEGGGASGASTDAGQGSSGSVTIKQVSYEYIEGADSFEDEYY